MKESSKKQREWSARHRAEVDSSPLAVAVREALREARRRGMNLREIQDATGINRVRVKRLCKMEDDPSIHATPNVLDLHLVLCSRLLTAEMRERLIAELRLPTEDLPDPGEAVPRDREGRRLTVKQREALRSRARRVKRQRRLELARVGISPTRAWIALDAARNGVCFTTVLGEEGAFIRLPRKAFLRLRPALEMLLRVNNVMLQMELDRAQVEGPWAGNDEGSGDEPTAA